MNHGAVYSNGSYDNGKATYAILAQPQKVYASLDEVDYDKLFYSSGLVEGSDWDMNSYHAELKGILAAIDSTNNLCCKLQILLGRCTRTLYCDSKGALSAAF